MSRRVIARLAAAGAIALAGAGLATPAFAHMSTFPSDAPAGGYTTVYFQVPHGCDGEPTSSVSVKLNEDISSVKPEAVAGWTAAVTKAPLAEPFESYGRQVTDYVDTVTWTADGAPLADDQFMRFGIVMKVPDRAGEELLLPAVQTCPSGAQEAWIDPEEEADMPAPRVVLTAAGDGHGHGGAGGGAATEEAATAVTESSTADSESSPLPLVLSIAALVVALGAGGLAIGARKSS